MTTIRERVRGTVCLGCSLLGLAVAPRAHAKGLAGATEVQLRTELFEYQSSKSTSSATNAPPGVPMPGPTSSSGQGSSFGLMGSGYGVELGYFISDHVQLGAGLQFSHGHSSGDALGFSSNLTNLSLVPRLEYLFDGERVRPYLAGFGGYQRAWYSSSESDFDSKSGSSGFVFGGAVGAHVFLGDSWSLDPELAIQRTSRDGTQSTTGPSDVSSVTYEYDSTFRATSVVLSIGLSGWFGGR